MTAYLVGVSLMGIVVAVVGWRLLQEDRALQRQQVGDRLETAADLAAVALRDGIADLRARISGFVADEEPIRAAAAMWTRDFPSDTFVVTLARDGVRAWPEGRLLFVPTVDTPRRAPVAAFVEGETLEFRDDDSAAAAEYFAWLSESSDPELEAGALLRLARNLRKDGRPYEALAAYERLLGCNDVTVEGRPAELLALQGRMAVREEAGDLAALGHEARELRDRLLQAEWSLSRATFEYYWALANEAIVAATGEAPGELDPALRAGPLAVEALWTDWRAGRDPGALPTVGEDGPPLIIGLPVDGAWIGLVAGAEFIDTELVGRADPMLERHRAKLVLLDRDGGRVVDTAPLAGNAEAPVARRTAAEAGLPWALHVSATDFDEELALLAGRRRLLAVGLVVMAVLVVAGGALSVQSVRRELRVADLKSSLVAAVSHEFRTPLTLLRQTTEALADGRVEDRATQHRYYGRQLRATDRLQRLVEGMLDFARLEADALELVATDFNAVDWLGEVVASFNHEAEGEASPVSLEAPSSAVELHADREALTRALWNLLDNAVKYSPDGSPVEVVSGVDGPWMTVAVRDRGPGVDPGDSEAIFEKFARGGRANRRAHGTGLGLAMAREIARAHGGNVTLQARPGGGSVFTLSLPLGESR